ncbi:hypothetical protein ACQR0V_30280 [Bradyrhizobium sp. HKCCYLS2058]|uniref:hypothetical protein n=1 Tax=unclassified Bradyrhizobium TaxID=2631580 RepID=UPI003EBD275E
MDVTTTIVKIIHGRMIRGVPQLNGEGMHDACFYLRKIIGARAERTGVRTGREAAQRAGGSRQSSCRAARSTCAA